ncbi:MAG: 4-(cytidine 5'-diphospho)-2-C-methyl-D-erythritol kinase [Treponema sp.]|jgi:4-diphosphocytidyl-2-C-methyl-D-erythritol kinase|nr:4-(cytidine 5'-diphospho)-2-C-methyl-D-erythritol kinase [Treponema sp.]
MLRITVPSPCKINLHLSVGGRRADGYHDVESIFQALDVGVTLDFELLDGDGLCDIRLDSPSGRGVFPVSPEDNLVYRAVSLFRRRTGFERSIGVRLEKRIPLGGGLGGGSSNAAATLGALNLLAETGLSPAELRDMALCLGSDVPFFLADTPADAPLGTASEGSPGLGSLPGYGGTAWVSGRGERIEALETRRSWPVVLVNPGFPSPTGEAFRRLDAWRGGEAGRAGPDREALIRALDSGPGDWPFWNDFLAVLGAGSAEEAMAYRRIISALRDLGAGFTGLSGAGSTCFGVFTDGGEAAKAARVVADHWIFVCETFFLARGAWRVLQC